MNSSSTNKSNGTPYFVCILRNCVHFYINSTDLF
uniref:Uncharacterized protein n=1 Tax=Anguilla anguilla TaxID=7936 RepID=A0A0E9VPP1_ANGAN